MDRYQRSRGNIRWYYSSSQQTHPNKEIAGTFPSMENTHEALKDNTTIIVFGASGDLATTRKETFPTLFGLFRQGFLPHGVRIVGYARTKMDREDFLKRATLYIRNPNDDPEIAANIEKFKTILTYVSGDYKDGAAFDNLNNHLEEIESGYPSRVCHRVFCLALPPSVSFPFAKMSNNIAISRRTVSAESSWRSLL
ncbi:hypothetical protein E1B28_011569 [Marasmius oreades]|uniref:glucose-6-phosphate dehydrogenase (NADP(+)) n=1 Tax=Marasmius oreades TaxID=181124 RepID=A0A9P7RUI9_9AGAR|nr:uncharacterized protein E1B28_011569 [Marasmius oreades]KAG7089940.1 hypothetical protein E1B28_011569 [Marasmius oreades]